jgi:hypothetical protein
MPVSDKKKKQELPVALMGCTYLMPATVLSACRERHSGNRCA